MTRWQPCNGQFYPLHGCSVRRSHVATRMTLRIIAIAMRRRAPIARRLFMACAALSIAVSTSAWAANISVGVGIRVERQLQSMKDLRDRNLIKQQFDYSCGAAALATILRFGLGDNVTERAVLVQLFDLESEEQKQT